jgi:hypothetical protein
VKFTATVDGHAVPVGHWWWDGPELASTRMVANSSGLRASDCPAKVPECEKVFEAVGSGRMTARLASGDTAWANAEAKDTTCWTGDYVLDNRAVRQQLPRLWQLSYTDSTDSWKRIEQSFSVYESGDSTWIRYNPSGANTACRAVIERGRSPGWVLIAEFHTHPHKPGQYVQCFQGAVPYQYKYEWGGPSPADWRGVVDTTGVDSAAFAGSYMLDEDNIVRIMNTYPPVTDSTHWFNFQGISVVPGGQLPPVQRAPDPQKIWDPKYRWAQARNVCKLY